MEALKSFVYQDWLTNTHTRFVRTYTSINRVRDRHDNQQSNQFNELPCEQRLKDIYSFWWTSSVHSFFFTPQSWLTRAHLLTSSLSPIHTHKHTCANIRTHIFSSSIRSRYRHFIRSQKCVIQFIWENVDSNVRLCPDAFINTCTYTHIFWDIRKKSCITCTHARSPALKYTRTHPQTHTLIRTQSICIMCLVSTESGVEFT